MFCKAIRSCSWMGNALATVDKPDFDAHVFTRCHFTNSFCRSFSWTIKVIFYNRKNSEREKHSANLLGWSGICSSCSPTETALKSLCSWCALPNSAYFLQFSLLAILNTGLRLLTCMLHSETTARTWGDCVISSGLCRFHAHWWRLQSLWCCLPEKAHMHAMRHAASW